MKLLKAADKALKAADPGSKTVLAGLPNESWEAIDQIYDAGRARLLRRRHAAPVHGQDRERDQDREDRPAAHGRAQGRQAADLGHRALVARGQGQDQRRRATSRPPTPGRRSGSRTGLELLAAQRVKLGIERVYWYTWLSVEGLTDQRVRLLGPATGAQRRAARRARAGDVQARGQAPGGLREAAWERAGLPLVPVRLRAAWRNRGATARSWLSGACAACFSRPCAGGVAFSMLPLGFVLFATGETGSNATAGVMVAAFTLASALAPVRGRIVDRHGGAALALVRVRVLGAGSCCWWSRRRSALRRGAGRAERAGGARAAAARAVHARGLGPRRCATGRCSGRSRSTRRARRAR